MPGGIWLLLKWTCIGLIIQAELFSRGHATFFGFGGDCSVHFLNAAGDGSLPVPMELMPLPADLTAPNGSPAACASAG
jgi:hypothetical protein